MMWWQSMLVFTSVALSNIYCENYYWPSDDKQSENRQILFDEHRQSNGRYQQTNMESSRTSSVASIRTMSETYAAGGSESIPIDGIVNRKNLRRTNNRRRKMGSSKKSIYRRGQRHRNNKNGNVHSSRQQISFCFSFVLCTLHLLAFYHSLFSFRFVLFRLFAFFNSLHNQRNNERILNNLGSARIRTHARSANCLCNYCWLFCALATSLTTTNHNAQQRQCQMKSRNDLDAVLICVCAETVGMTSKRRAHFSAAAVSAAVTSQSLRSFNSTACAF